MSRQCCANCVYCYYSAEMKLSAFAPGFPVRPLCANHPEAPGQLRAVSPGGICRNYRARPPGPAQPEETVRRIPLSRGRSVLVDAADYEWLRHYKWHPAGSGGYAGRNENGKTILMHRQIMNAPKGTVVDHIDGSAENNCRSNLRICTPQENQRNQTKRIGSASRFKGVYRYLKTDRWFAKIVFSGEPVWLGIHEDESEAARAYDRAAVALFGAFAYLNLPEEWPPERRQEVYANGPALRAAVMAKAQAAQARKGRGKTGKRKGQKAKGKRAPARAGTRERRERNRTTKKRRSARLAPRSARR